MASILPQGKTQFFDATGNPLSGGSVTFYAKGTTNYQNTYQDQGQTILNSNPVILDSSGSALIWGSGNYSTIVKDALGNQISSPDTAANLTVASVLLEVLPTTSTTITPTALKTIVIPVPSAAATITIEPGTIEGQEVIVYGSESWAITVASNVITGGPAFYYPDGSVNYSITLPLNAIDQITLIWDGLNWRCTTFGQTIVSPAVASNQAVNLSQLNALFGTITNVTASRSAATIYTNSTGRPLFVSISLTMVANVSATAALQVNGLECSLTSPGVNGGTFQSVSAVVPAGATYELIYQNYASTINGWMEAN